MKILSKLTIITLACVIWTAAAQTKAADADQPAAHQAQAFPKISASTPKLDLGELPEDIKTSFDYTLSNQGQAPLHIKGAKGSCGCTEVELEDYELAPGQSTRLLVTFDTHGRSGQQYKTIDVLSDDPGTPKLTLSFSAHIHPTLTLKPSAVDFGKINPQEELSREVEIEVRGPQPLEIKKLELSGTQAFSASVVECTAKTVKTVDRHATETLSTARISVEKTGPLPLGPVAAYLGVRTNLPQRPLIRIRLRALVEGDLTCQPERISFGTLTSGQSATRKVRVENKRKQPLTITGVECSQPAYSWRVLEGAKPWVKELEITLTAPAGQNRNMRTGLLIHAGEATTQTLRLDLSGVVITQRK